MPQPNADIGSSVSALGVLSPEPKFPPELACMRSNTQLEAILRNPRIWPLSCAGAPEVAKRGSRLQLRRPQPTRERIYMTIRLLKLLSNSVRAMPGHPGNGPGILADQFLRCCWSVTECGKPQSISEAHVYRLRNERMKDVGE